MTAPEVDLADDDAYRAHRGEWRLVDLGPRQYLAVDGHGDPDGAAFAPAVESLYPVAAALRTASEDAGRGYVVPPLEGLWWAQDLDASTRRRDRAVWEWTLLLAVPHWLGAAEVEAAVERTRPQAPPRLDDVRLETLTEGRCMQTLHVGAFDDEGPVLRRLHTEVLPGAGFAPTGKHHEVYLTDLRRTEPAARRTILRQPIA
ncbi:GyrI-like domain-containing protein [Klenkia brasiliensis]|uniref:GyrI-like small molecule binding domain-containing protein n=1 Tax=Klenkia brasiliensis TaxID=333142 RepID=A0A1G7UWH1_9ACTN|nr:GyrI-like domain-containing protein [Klenkia brasiliensis]SDG51631.1 hypothetical protein SAMN05660324_2795 [Klenkia brasiliensis]